MIHETNFIPEEGNDMLSNRQGHSQAFQKRVSNLFTAINLVYILALIVSIIQRLSSFDNSLNPSRNNESFDALSSLFWMFLSVALLLFIVDIYLICRRTTITTALLFSILILKHSLLLLSIQLASKEQCNQINLLVFVCISAEYTRRLRWLPLPFILYHSLIYILTYDFRAMTSIFFALSIITTASIFCLDSATQALFCHSPFNNSKHTLSSITYFMSLPALMFNPLQSQNSLRIKEEHINLNNMPNHLASSEGMPHIGSIIRMNPCHISTQQMSIAQFNSKTALDQTTTPLPTVLRHLKSKQGTSLMGTSNIPQTMKQSTFSYLFKKPSLSDQDLQTSLMSSYLPFPCVVFCWNKTKMKAEIQELNKTIDEAFLSEMQIDSLSLPVLQFINLIFDPKYSQLQAINNNEYLCSNASRSTICKMYAVHQNQALDTLQSTNKSLNKQVLILYFIEVTDIIKEFQITDTSKRKGDQNSQGYRDDLLATVSHDIKNLLNGMVSMLDLCESELKQVNYQNLDAVSNRVINYISLAQKNSQLLLFLVHDVQDYYQHSKQKLRLLPTEFNVHLMFEEIKSLFLMSSQTKGILLSFESFLQNPILFTDGHRLKQVLINLISNAIKFTSRGGSVKVTIKTTTSPKIVKVAVEDTGAGISDEIKNNLFKLYQTFDTGGANPRGMNKPSLSFLQLYLIICFINEGVGLGLVISQNIVKQMGPAKQSITVTSEKGVGSNFSFFIFEKLHEKTLFEKTEGESIKSLEDHDTSFSMKDDELHPQNPFEIECGEIDSCEYQSHTNASYNLHLPRVTDSFHTNNIQRIGIAFNENMDSFNDSVSSPIVNPHSGALPNIHEHGCNLSLFSNRRQNQADENEKSRSQYMPSSERRITEFDNNNPSIEGIMKTYNQPFNEVILLQIPSIDSHLKRIKTLQRITTVDQLVVPSSSSPLVRLNKPQLTYSRTQALPHNGEANNIRHTIESMKDSTLSLSHHPISQTPTAGFNKNTLSPLHFPYQQSKNSFNKSITMPTRPIRKLSSSYFITNQVQGGQNTFGNPSTPQQDQANNEEFIDALNALRIQNIMIVDDDSMNTFVMSQILNFLQNFNFFITVRHSGQEVIELLRPNPNAIQLLFIDENMPELTGIDTISEVKAINPSIIAIIVSADPETDFAESNLVDGYLSKPTRLVNIIKKIIEIYHRINSNTPLLTNLDNVITGPTDRPYYD